MTRRAGASSEFGGSPGWAGEGFRGDVVINELLTHTDLPEIDGIELHNHTTQPIDTAGWYISDSAANLFRFQIGNGDSVIRPEDYQAYLRGRARVRLSRSGSGQRFPGGTGQHRQADPLRRFRDV